MPIKDSHYNEAIETIRDDVLRAKDRKQNVPYYLAKGYHEDRRAISAVRNAGRFAIITSAVFIVIIIVGFISLLVNFNASVEASIARTGVFLFFTYVFVLIIPAIELILGIKLFGLNVTPMEAKTYLWIIILLNILPLATGFPGLLGILTIIFAINALVRLPMYEQWFERRFRAMWRLKPDAKTPLNKNNERHKGKINAKDEDADGYDDML